MDLIPYQINFWNGDQLSLAEVKPCCREENVVDYAIYMDIHLSFNITRSTENKEKWVISLKNADREIDDEIIQGIGSKIDLHNQH